MESETAPLNEDLVSFKRVVNYLYTSGFHAGREEGYKQATSNISVSRKAFVYSGHFAFGIFVGIVIGMVMVASVCRIA